MNSKKIYYPQLDAIRGLSFLAVFFFHAYKPGKATNGLQAFFVFVYSKLPLSIDIFFILSSFLLTFLGINEYKLRGNFSFKNYFIRRALRIWPLYYLLMFFSFVVLKLFQKYTGQQITLPPAEWYLFFISNFYQPDHVFFLRLLWTLSVEEQFYLFWGLCLLLFQKYMLWVIAILAFISIIFNIATTITGSDIYFHTLTYVADMMIGAFAAYSIAQNNWVVNVVGRLKGKASFLFYLILPILLVFFFFIDKNTSELANDFAALLFKFLFSFYIGLVIIDQMVNSNNITSLSGKKFLIYSGKISYGLYCFHGIVITFGMLLLKKSGLVLPSIVNTILLLIATFAIASLSYTIIEKPFLKLKDKLNRT
jgi:peptidoglycan/LPS O-acetylase OafA/YrhL